MRDLEDEYVVPLWTVQYRYNDDPRGWSWETYKNVKTPSEKLAREFYEEANATYRKVRMLKFGWSVEEES